MTERFFIEVAYKGTGYAGFQKQENANTIQAEVEKALQVFFKKQFDLTGSSRTDAGVHAWMNFFHVDAADLPGQEQLNRKIYNINAILPEDIVIKKFFRVHADAHCRFDAASRLYEYSIYLSKDPFLADTAYYFPYKLDLAAMQEAANMISKHTDFTSFSKQNSQVKTFICSIIKSEWIQEGGRLVYRVQANRFLRGMVRGLTGTMLRVGTGKLSLQDFNGIIEGKDATKADFSVPPHGLFLVRVEYPDSCLPVG